MRYLIVAELLGHTVYTCIPLYTFLTTTAIRLPARWCDDNRYNRQSTL